MNKGLGSQMPGVKDMPGVAPLGSFHVLKMADGALAVGRFTAEGWVIFLPQPPVRAEDAQAQGFRHYRPILEGRRVLSEG